MNPSVETVWFTRCPSPSASSIAINSGLLERAFAGTGVTVRSLRSSQDRAVRQSHFTQRHEALFRQGGIVPPLWAAAAETPTSLLALNEVPRFQGLIALPASGLTSPGDLRGRRIGLPRHTGEPVDFWRAHTWRGIVGALEIARLAESDVTLVDLPTDAPYHFKKSLSQDASLWTAREATRLQSREVLALVRGEVDAIYTYAPTGLPLIELLGANIIVSLPKSGPGSSGIGGLTVLTVSQQLIDDHLDLVARYVAALLEAASWASVHRAEALRVFAAEEGVATEWAVSSFDGPTGVDLTPTLTAPLLEALQLEADFLAERKLIARRVDVADWADDRPLRLAQQQRPAVTSRRQRRGQVRLSDIPKLQEEIA